MTRTPIFISVLALACARAAEPPSVSPRAMEAPEVGDAPWRGGSDASGLESPPLEGTVVIRGAKILIGDGSFIARGHVIVESGKITSVGEGDGDVDASVPVIDATGRFVTPGLIDTHSHLGVYPSPAADAHEDGNEATSPVTAEVRAVDSFWPGDPGIERAVAGGTTTIQALPGSANLVGGRAVTLKLRRATSAREMHFLGAKDGLKMACGENPKRVYGQRKSAPSTRMGNLAKQREAFFGARKLIDEWDEYLDGERKRRKDFADARAATAAKRAERGKRRRWCKEGSTKARVATCEGWERDWAKETLDDPEIAEGKNPPARDLSKETLAGALEGQIIVHVHCYRADDMASMLALSDEVGFTIRSFHHALDAYKIRHELARRRIGVSTWADWWGFKLEAYDGIQENIALVEEAGGIPIVHSDSAEGIQRLNQEASKALWSGIHAGVKLDPARTITWITKNPAWALGVDDRVGTLEKGKDADIVIWSADPTSVYARAEVVLIDGTVVHDVAKPSSAWSDFEAAP